MSDYLVWDTAKVTGGVVLHSLENVEKRYQLVRGVSRAVGWPADAHFTQNPDFPKATGLVDTPINTDRVVVASRRLCDLVRLDGATSVEFLPVSIRGVSGTVLSADYFIVHPVDSPACLDMTRSIVEISPFDRDEIDSVSSLTIDDTKVPPDRDILRPNPYCDVVVVRKRLADRLSAAGFTGLSWRDPATYRA